MSWRSYPLEALQSPVTADELRGFLVYPAFTSDEEALADRLLLSATAAISDELQREVSPRRRRFESPEWPSYGTASRKLSGGLETARDGVTLPYGPVLSVESVLVDGEAYDDWELEGDILMMDAHDDLVVDYTAGYDSSTDSAHLPPPQLEEAILTLAAWRWHHRAESAANALRDSGALDMLQPLRVPML